MKKPKSYQAWVRGTPTYLKAYNKKNALIGFRRLDPKLKLKDVMCVKTTLTSNSTPVELVNPELFN